MKKEFEDLKPQHQLFIEEYVKDWNAAEAARRCGYSSPNVYGARLASKLAPHILKLHHMRMQKIGLSRDNIALNLVMHMKRCSGEIPVKETVKLKREDGSEYLEDAMVYKFDANGFNKANELLGKMYRLMDNKLEINVNKREMGVLVVPELKKDAEKDITPKGELLPQTEPVAFPPLIKDVEPEPVEVKQDGESNLATDARVTD